MKARILAAVVALALGAGVSYRVLQQDAAESRKPPGEGRALGVKTVPVAVRDFPHVIDLPGTLEARQQATITSQVGGTLLKQHVREGESAKAGQPLFSLDARPAEASAAQNRASLAGAQAQLAEAEKKYERLKPLAPSGYISQQELDDARAALESARAGAGSARAALDAAQLEVQYAQIRAPFAGRVGRIPVKPGDRVQAGNTVLTTLTAPGALDARASVAQQDWPALNAARAQGPVRARVFRDLAATPLAEGELDFVDPQIDAASGAVQIKIGLRGDTSQLIAGQGVRLRLRLGAEPAARVVPEAAVQHGQDGTYVYVVRGGRATVQPVRVLRTLDGEVAVAGNLRAGEPVLVEIPQRLKAGGKVVLQGAGKDGAPRP